MKNVQKKMMDDGCNGLKEWRNDMHTWWRFIQHTEILFNFIACNPIYLFLLNVLYTLWHTHTHIKWKQILLYEQLNILLTHILTKQKL